MFVINVLDFEAILCHRHYIYSWLKSYRHYLLIVCIYLHILLVLDITVGWVTGRTSGLQKSRTSNFEEHSEESA